MSTLNAKLDSIINKLDTLEEKLSAQANRISDVEKQVAENIEKIYNIEDRLDNNMPSQESYNQLNERLEDQANRLRRNNIVMHNVPEGAEGIEKNDCSEFVCKFLSEHMKIEDAKHFEIERAHRSPTGPPRDGHIRPIHVKFLRYKDRANVLKMAPRTLKDNPFKGRNIFISDDVTETVRKQRKKLLEMKRQIQIRFPGKRVFIPPVVPAILLREGDNGKLLRMKPGDVLEGERME